MTRIVHTSAAMLAAVTVCLAPLWGSSAQYSALNHDESRTIVGGDEYDDFALCTPGPVACAGTCTPPTCPPPVGILCPQPTGAAIGAAGCDPTLTQSGCFTDDLSSDCWYFATVGCGGLQAPTRCGPVQGGGCGGSCAASTLTEVWWPTSASCYNCATIP